MHKLDDTSIQNGFKINKVTNNVWSISIFEVLFVVDVLPTMAYDQSPVLMHGEKYGSLLRVLRGPATWQ